MKERILELIKSKAYQPLAFLDIKKVLEVENKEDKAFTQAILELETIGAIIKIKKLYYDAQKVGYYAGKITIKEKGFGFVITNNEEIGDIYIAKENIRNAFHNDKVLVRLMDIKQENGFSKEGYVEKILERGSQFIVGVITEDPKNKENFLIINDDKKMNLTIAVKKNNAKGALVDHKVQAEIIKYVSSSLLYAQVTEILGHKNDPGIDVLSIVYQHNLPTIFSKELMDSIEKVPDSVLEKELVNRKNLTKTMTITIDGKDAKDLDDAISLEKTNQNTFLLGVHIADVSHYVTENSLLDEEALLRGTSVYLADRVIPMLPHKLSNGICSLNPNVIRLTQTCQMEISLEGEVLNYQIYPSYIISKYRMTYDDVNEMIINQNDKLIRKYHEIYSMLNDMQELSSILRLKRQKRGAIDFDSAESKIIVDDTGKAIDIIARTRDKAEMLIEDFMLIANETVAFHLEKKKIPGIYRVHEIPDTKKLNKVMKVINYLGYKMKVRPENITSFHLQGLLKKMEGKEEEKPLNSLILRAMMKAKYHEENIGHYGLAAKYYLHFTSPIRRYPDLMVQRMLRKFYFNSYNEDDLKAWRNKIPEIALQNSKSEREAIETEREVEDMKKAEYMSAYIGKKFQGIISSITNFGLFIELNNTVEGLVHVTDLEDDYYEFNDELLIFIGRKTKKIYKIGDKVTIKVKAASKADGTIDFILC